MNRRTLVLIVAAVMATAAGAYAQRFGQGRGGRRGGEGGFARQEPPRRPDATSFTGDFTFCRLAYRMAYDGDGGGGASITRARTKTFQSGYLSSPKRPSISIRPAIPITT